MKSSSQQRIIESELQKTCPDWQIIENAIIEIGDNINYINDDNETILSDMYFCGGPGNNLLKLTQLFLAHGYDVHANGEKNGAACLRQLCWSSYDQFILQISEELLNVGANPRITLDEDDDRGLLDSIEWKLGYWNTGECDCANIFEAYYTQIERHLAGKPYIGIRAFDECIGRSVKKIEIIALDGEVVRDKDGFKGAMVIWADDKPLVISDYLDMMVNPYSLSETTDRQDISEELPELIGKKIRWMHFAYYGMAEITFDTGERLVFLDSKIFENSQGYERYIHFKTSRKNKTKDVFSKGQKFEAAYLCSGVLQSKASLEYDEGMLMLDDGTRILQLSSKRLDHDDSEIIVHILPREWIKEGARHIVGGPFTYLDMRTTKKGRVEKLIFQEKDAYITIKADDDNIALCKTNNYDDEDATFLPLVFSNGYYSKENAAT